MRINRTLPIGTVLLLTLGGIAQAATTTPPAAPAKGDPDDGFQGEAPPISSIRQQIQDQLTNAGYKDVTIVPSSFYIHAKNKAGDPVAMIIGPDSMTTVTELPGKGGTLPAK